MTSQSGYQTVAVHILPDISRSKGNQTMKFGQVTKETFFFENRAKNEGGRLIPDVFSFFKKALYEEKASGLQLSFNIF